MCDYSLMSIPNRLAREGEELVVERFSTGSMGFASPSAQCGGWWEAVKSFFNPGPQVAVCIPPGARLMLRDIPHELQTEWRVNGVEEVAFTQISAATNHYRDAVRFRNGKEVLLQRLRSGQHARVLDLSCAGEAEPVWQEQLQTPYQLVRTS